MNKTTIFFLSLLLGTLILGTSCQKTKDLVDPPSQTELLSAEGVWKLVAQTIDPALPGTTVTNEYDQLDACEKDNNLNYTATNAFSIDEGAVKCSENDPQVVSGTWALNGEGNVITMTFTGGSTDVRTISVLERNEMTLVHNWTANNINYKRTYKYEH